MMASVTKENSSDVSVNLRDQLGRLVLKEEHKLAVEVLLSVKDVMAILPTGFVKSIIYQFFTMAKNFIPYFIFWSPNKDGRFNLLAFICTALRRPVDSLTSLRFRRLCKSFKP